MYGKDLSAKDSFQRSFSLLKEKSYKGQLHIALYEKAVTQLNRFS